MEEISPNNILEVSHISASYQEGKQRKTVLHDISFELHENEILGLVGESGCGKSTLSKVILGFIPVAAAMFNKVPVKGKKTVCLVSGGNIDVTILSRVISRGMAKSGRTYAVTLDLIDKPGQLLGVSKIVAEQGGNVISVHHERNSESADVTGCALRVVMETRNEEHIASIRQKLLDAGYVIMK